MDRQLAERLNELWQQGALVDGAEKVYLALEGNRKSLLAELTLKAPGKSFAEREAMALASQDWRDFMNGHVEAQSTLNSETRKFNILDKAFYAEYGTMKNEERSIKKPAVGA